MQHLSVIVSRIAIYLLAVVFIIFGIFHFIYPRICWYMSPIFYQVVLAGRPLLVQVLYS